MRIRRSIAARYLSGSGIELGALHQPLATPPGVRVRYVDRIAEEGLRRQYPELSRLRLVPVDVVDDAERLAAFEDRSVDFVIANHLIEHTQDPIGALENWVRVVRPGGVVYLAVPDKRHTFDRDRPVTPLDHLIRDHAGRPEPSRRAHFEEWVRLVDHTPDEDVDSRVEALLDMDYSIHFHVWTEMELLELLVHCRSREGIPFSIELFQRNGMENIAVLRRTAALAPA